MSDGAGTNRTAHHEGVLTSRDELTASANRLPNLPPYRLPAATRLGTVHLQVANLARSVAYYHDVVGLSLLRLSGGVAELGAGTPPLDTSRDTLPVLLALHERPGAAPVVPLGRYGLFHVAILLPDRSSLGQFLMHLAARGERPGMSDHMVSEAIYLSDPDGHGLEVYADRPRDSWRERDGQLLMGTAALDARAVMASANGEPWNGAPAGTTVGHVHLHVGSIDDASRFFHGALGFDRTVWDYPGALFLAAGGYHHHLGTNTWARRAVASKEDEARLLEWTIELPTHADVQDVAGSCDRCHVAYARDDNAITLHDPWGTAIRIQAGPVNPVIRISPSPSP